MILNWQDDGWRRRFAIIPIMLSDGPHKRLIWLQWVWKRDMCLYTQVSIDNPRLAQAIEAGTDETRSGSAEGESAVPQECAKKSMP